MSFQERFARVPERSRAFPAFRWLYIKSHNGSHYYYTMQNLYFNIKRKKAEVPRGVVEVWLKFDKMQ